MSPDIGRFLLILVMHQGDPCHEMNSMNFGKIIDPAYSKTLLV